MIKYFNMSFVPHLYGIVCGNFSTLIPFELKITSVHLCTHPWKDVTVICWVSDCNNNDIIVFLFSFWTLSVLDVTSTLHSSLLHEQNSIQQDLQKTWHPHYSAIIQWEFMYTHVWMCVHSYVYECTWEMTWAYHCRKHRLWSGSRHCTFILDKHSQWQWTNSVNNVAHSHILNENVSETKHTASSGCINVVGHGWVCPHSILTHFILKVSQVCRHNLTVV